MAMTREPNDTFDPYDPAGVRRDDAARREEKKAIQGGDVGNVAADQLRNYIERIERLEEEKASIADDIKTVYGDLKGFGFDPKAVRTIIRMRKEDPAKRAEREAVLDTYLAALGMV